MDAQLRTFVETFTEDCEWCRAMNGEACYHCTERETLISVACAWAFDLGQRIPPASGCAHYNSDCCGAPCSSTL